MFNRNFITLLKIFHRHPYMFLNFLLKNEAFNDDFKTKLKKTVIKEKPYFTDVTKMLDYYLNLITDDNMSVDKEAQWNNKLCKAIAQQRYEDAATIRDYMNSKKYKIYI